jgi:maltose O-acetyltransferase
MNLLRQTWRHLRRAIQGDPLDALKQRGLRVGRNFHWFESVIIDPSHCEHIRIGDDVTLAPRVYLLAHDASTKRALDRTRIGTVEIGDRVFIGAGAMVLPGVRIGSDVVIGAGSVVTRDIPDGSVAAGNPARVLGDTDDWLDKRRAQLATRSERFHFIP